MGPFKAACIIALVLFLALLASFQLEQRDRITALEHQVKSQYELILHLYGQALEPGVRNQDPPHKAPDYRLQPKG